MRQTAVLLSLLSCFTLSGTAFAADSQLMNLVMPDAKILAGVNVTSAENSPLGQFLLSKLGLIGGVPQDFITATGFNPLQDVSEVLAATAADPAHHGLLVLARGTFPVDKIGGLLAGNKNWQVTTYGGATLVSATNPKEKQAVAFIGNSIAVAGDLASVQAAIDRNTGVNSIDPALASTVNQLSGSEDEWLASSASVGSLIPAKATLGAAGTANPAAATILPLLKNIQAFNGGVKFGDTVAITGQAVTSSPQNASALNAVIRLGVMLAGSAGGNTAANQQLAALTQVFQTLQVTVNGPAVDLSLSISEAQIETLVNSLSTTAKAVASVRPAGPSDIHNGN
jgi:hypothetical protein